MSRDPLYPRNVLTRERDPRPRERAASSAGMVLESLRTRPVPRRILKGIAVLMFLAGVAVFTYPFATNWYADWRQGNLQRQFASDATRARYVTRTVGTGDALTRIVIPKLGLDTIVVEGTEPSALRAGAGHYATSALPCDPGNAAIAGHRTTYSKPFANLDLLGPGDEIVLETPVGRCRYAVEGRPFVVAPDAWEVVEPVRGRSLLTLTTCHPPGSAAERLIVRARLIVPS